MHAAVHHSQLALSQPAELRAARPCSAHIACRAPHGVIARRAPDLRPLRRQRGAAPPAAAAGEAVQAAEVPRLDPALDDELSKRPLQLDAAGYFIIKVDVEARELVADFYTNTINEQGLACDPATGEVISCKPGAVRQPTRTWRGRTAKELSVAILEADHGFQPCTHLEHANYLGRELQRAEFALLAGQRYVQD